MKYFIDTEFVEGQQDKRFLGFKIGGKTKPTIDLISIGIISDDIKYMGGVDPIKKDAKVQTNKYDVSKKYYAISKDFNIKEAWYRWQWEVPKFDSAKFRQKGMTDTIAKASAPHQVYWIRENVLRPIFNELLEKEQVANCKEKTFNNILFKGDKKEFTYCNFKRLVHKYGKANKQIAKEIREFCKPTRNLKVLKPKTIQYSEIKHPKFYAYYADYDWVAFCWLFGKMIDLPKNFPKYCIDLKQELERLNEAFQYNKDLKEKPYRLQDDHQEYPKQENEHNALADAIWNKKLYNFLQKIK